MAIGTINKTVTQINNLLDEVENMSSTYATQADVAQDIATATNDMATQTQVAADIASAVAPLAEKDGNYPKMSVGFAENIVGDGTATEEEFSFRPTAGVNRNVETTTYDYDMRSNFGARIESVKGNSVVWNQHFKGLNTRTAYGYRVSSQGNVVTIENVSASTPDFGNLSDIIDFSITAGHKYLALANSSLSLVINGLVGWSFRVNMISDSAPDLDYSATWLRTASAPSLDILPVGGSVSFPLVIHDLTQMFGAGNEPTTIEEFYSLLPTNVDLNAYNEGEIVNANYGAIKTTGFNQYNGTYAKVVGGCPYYLGSGVSSAGFTTEEGGATETIVIPTNRLYTPSQNGYIYAVGSNICINLAWDEYSALNGTYAPYKPFERDLSWISQYFPEGMRRADSVSDEIRFNSTTQKWEAVRRVGVRAYASGDESDTTLTTDGTNTNYPLATPLVAEIEEILNVDFDVADYGTEELIVADGVKSAPFLGNIIYTPNALKTLEQIPDILRRLTALENA